MNCNRRTTWTILRLSLATLALGGAQGACAQETTGSGGAQGSPSPPKSSVEPLVLEVYDFVLAGGSDNLERDKLLQQALPDSLSLRLLLDPRIKMRRIREAYAPTSPAAGASQEPHAGDSSARYTLDGKIVFIDKFGSVFITYLLRQAGRQGVLKEGNEPTNLAQLPATLAKISEQVLIALLPQSRVSLCIKSPQLVDIPKDRQSFYQENLPGLLETELRRQGWIDVSRGTQKTDFTIDESVRSNKEKRGYDLTVSIFHGDVLLPPPLKGFASETQVLAVQLQLAGRITDALKATNVLSPATTDASKQPSANDYVDTAESYEKKDPDLSIALYRRALELDSSNTRARLSLAYTYITKGQADNALDLLQGPDLDNIAQAQYLRSGAFYFTNRMEEAMRAANRAVELAPDIGVWYFWRGYLYEVQKDFGKALRDFEMARKIDPTDPDYYEYAAAAHEKLGQYDQAVAVLESGRNLPGQGPRILHSANETRRRAAAYFLNVGNPKEALHFALASLADEKDSEWGQRLVGIAYHRLSNLSEAENSLNRALAIMKTESAYEELARLRLEQGRKQEALSLAEKAIETDDSVPNAYGVLEDGVTGPEDAKEVIHWLKEYSAKKPYSRLPLADWDYFQSQYLPHDRAAFHELYLVFQEATKSVPYGDWVDGWTDLAELQIMEGQYAEAANVSKGLIKFAPRPEYHIGLRLYIWVSQLLLKDCGQSQPALNDFLNYLARPELNGFKSGWVFGALHTSLSSKADQGAFDPQDWLLVQAAFQVLERQPLQRADIDKFLANARSSNPSSCTNTPVHGF